MTDALLWHRIQFVFTITYHYLFPQLTMGLALFIVVFKSLALRPRDESYNEVARFWSRIFALNFAMGVVTGIPMEFQFGTNWSRFSRFSGEVVGQALAMEGVFAFFLESTFLGLFLFGEQRLGPRKHLAAAVALALGSWLSGYFIIVANAFMQHPVGHRLGEDGILHLKSFWAYIFNPWALWQFTHNMAASLVTASFVVAAVGAYWSLLGQHARHAGICLRAGVVGGARREPRGRVPDRGRRRQNGGEAPAGHTRRDGGAIRWRPVRRARHHRAARCHRPQAGKPGRRALDLELPVLRVFREHRPRAERLPD